MIYKEGEIVVDYTPFIYENGEQYYFRIECRNSSNYHYIRAYEKSEVEKTITSGYLWWKKTEKYKVDDYKLLGEELIDTNFDGYKIKSNLGRIMKRIHFNFEGWDGFVGDVSEEERKRIVRNTKINQLSK